MNSNFQNGETKKRKNWDIGIHEFQCSKTEESAQALSVVHLYITVLEWRKGTRTSEVIPYCRNYREARNHPEIMEKLSRK